MSWWDDFWKGLTTVKGEDRQQSPSAFRMSGPNYEAPNREPANRQAAAPPRRDTSTLQAVPSEDMWKTRSKVFGNNNMTNRPPADSLPPVAEVPTDNSNVLEGYLREIQDRLARSEATAPTINLDTKPIDTAHNASTDALAQALDMVLKSVEGARANTNQAYGNARAETQGSYDAIEGRSRVEGKKFAEDAGKNTSDELAKAASVAMAGINQNSTDSDKLQQTSSNNLGGSNAALREIQKNVDPNNTADSIRNNIASSYQDQAGNAARQTGRDVTAAGRYADTIGTDGASAIADLMSQLAGRNNQFDRDIQSAQTSNAGNVASLESSYADKLMQAQLAKQQEQNSVNQQAWQTNTTNDSNALSGMLDLFSQENEASLGQQQLKAEQDSNNSRAKNDQILALLKGMVGNTERNTMSPEDIEQLLASIQ